MRRTRLAALALAAALGSTACTPGGGGATPAPSSADVPASEARSRNGEIPAFSYPTDVTNPYLPFAQGGRWISEGTKEGEPYLVEVAVTPDRRTVDWQQGSTETLVVRHLGWVAGVLMEETLDYYAQGDDGGVWYFGEDVSNFSDGELVDHEGSWLAGRDGALPALLMPGAPEVGQVFYSPTRARCGSSRGHRTAPSPRPPPRSRTPRPWTTPPSA